MVGELIKSVRKRKNLTQQVFAKMLGTSAGFVSEVENGLKMPGYDLLLSLKREFPDVDLNWLLTGVEEPQPTIVSEKPVGFQPEPVAAPSLGLPFTIDEPELSIHPQYANAVHKLFNDMSAAERKIKRLSAKLERIVNEGDHKKIKLLETQLEFLDPGVKNQNVVNEQNG